VKAKKRNEVSTGNTLVTYDSSGSGEFTLYEMGNRIYMRRWEGGERSRDTVKKP
jgi:hypothetical protein